VRIRESPGGAQSFVFVVDSTKAQIVAGGGAAMVLRATALDDIRIGDDGNVGMGTSLSTVALHIQRSGSPVELKLDAVGAVNSSLSFVESNTFGIAFSYEPTTNTLTLERRSSGDVFMLFNDRGTITIDGTTLQQGIMILQGTGGGCFQQQDDDDTTFTRLTVRDGVPTWTAGPC
jgi:hypothetical protein